MFRYHEVKQHNDRLLQHLEDARAENLEEELKFAHALIPKRSLNKLYTCNKEREALISCYKSQGNGLDCKGVVSLFQSCAHQNKKKLLGNDDL